MGLRWGRGVHKTHHYNRRGIQHNTARWGVVKTHHLEMRGGGSKSTGNFYQSNFLIARKRS